MGQLEVRIIWDGPSGSRDSLTRGKLKPAQGWHLPKANPRLASALAQPGSMWRGGEGRGGVDGCSRLGTALGKTPEPGTRVAGDTRVHTVYWPA